MKRKGITIFEQHAEKAVLGLSAVALLTVLALQFLLTPNHVEVSGRLIPPGEVYAQVEAEALALKGQLQDPEPRLPELVTPDLISRLEPLTAPGPLLAAAVVDPPVVEPRVPAGVTVAVVETGRVMDLRVAAPSRPVAVSRWSTLDPWFVESWPAIGERLEAQGQPFDAPSVSVEAIVDGTAIQRALSGAEPGRRPIPTGWLADGVEIVRVNVERQERAPGSSEWGSATPVSFPFWAEELFEVVLRSPDAGLSQARGPAPDPAQDPAQDPSQDPAQGPLVVQSPQDLTRLVAAARANPALSARPPTFPIIAGAEWRRPTTVGDAFVELDRVEAIPRLRRELEAIDAELERRREAGTGGNAPRRPVDPPTRRRAGGRGNNQPAPTTQADQQVSIVERAIEGLTAEKERIEAELAEIDAVMSGAVDTGSDGSTVDTSPLLTSEAFAVWTHDADVRPGSSYRYRFSVEVNNPLFGRQRLLADDPELLAIAERPTVSSPFTEWSEPVEVDRADYIFIVNAAEGSELGDDEPTARAEVYHMYYGSYRQSTVRLRPGIAPATQIDLTGGVDLYTYRTDLLTAEAIKQFDQHRADVAREAERLATNPEADPIEVTPLPEAFERVESSQPIQVGVVLIDVSPVPATSGGSGAIEIVFYDSLSGRIESRRLGEHLQDPGYARARLSVLLSEDEAPLVPAPKATP